MQKNTISIIINKPINEVFEFTTNPKNTHLWVSFISEEVASEYPPKINTIYKSRRGKKWSKMKVVKFDKNKIFTLSSLDEKLFVKYKYYKLNNNKTRLEYCDWLVGGDFKSPITENILKNLKKIMEDKLYFK